jgi:hypothetical protein
VAVKVSKSYRGLPVPTIQALIDHLREAAQGRDDIRTECARLTAPRYGITWQAAPTITTSARYNETTLARIKACKWR